MNDDRDGYLDAFGVPVRIKGAAMVGIIDDDYLETELGRSSIASRAPALLLKTPDATEVALARGDVVSIWDVESSTWRDYQVTSIQANTDGFSQIRMIEP